VICAATEKTPADARVEHGSAGRSVVEARNRISKSYCRKEIAKELEGKFTVLDRIQDGPGPSIEEVVEATTLGKSTLRGHFYGEHYDGPTSMERLQAYHDRMDMLMRVYTRLPEQILLDAARAAERIDVSSPTCRKINSRQH
jgi:hypothetical protein